MQNHGPKQTIIINGVEYIPVDTPVTDYHYDCSDCEIFKSRPPRNMAEHPICCDIEYIEVNKSCCEMLRKDINRIWKIK